MTMENDIVHWTAQLPEDERRLSDATIAANEIELILALLDELERISMAEDGVDDLIARMTATIEHDSAAKDDGYFAALDKLRADLDWRGANGSKMGHVVLKRELAEALVRMFGG